jgi:hypothetical protein
MGQIEVTSAALLTVAGAATFALVVVALAKRFIAEERVYNLIGVIAALAIPLIAVCVQAEGLPTAEAGFQAAVTGVFAAGLATLGYEGFFNLLGLLGVGKRSDAARRAPSPK